MEIFFDICIYIFFNFIYILSRKKHDVKIVILKEIFRDRLDGTRFINNIHSPKVFHTNNVTTTIMILIASRMLESLDRHKYWNWYFAEF